MTGFDNEVQVPASLSNGDPESDASGVER